MNQFEIRLTPRTDKNGDEYLIGGADLPALTSRLVGDVLTLARILRHKEVNVLGESIMTKDSPVQRHAAVLACARRRVNNAGSNDGQHILWNRRWHDAAGPVEAGKVR